MATQCIPGMSMDLQKQYLDHSLIDNRQSDDIEKWFREATSQSSQPLGVNTQGYVAPFFERAKVYGPPPQRKENDSQFDSLVNKYFKKSSFEEIIESIFCFNEKWEFLKSLGYRPANEEINNSDVTGQTLVIRDGGHGTIDNTFLREISIKFKNLLLAKSTLKLKL